MLKNVEMIFCCSCSKLVAREDARHFFQTGFYRVVIPLGECMECSKSETNDLASLAAGIKDDTVLMHGYH